MRIKLRNIRLQKILIFLIFISLSVLSKPPFVKATSHEFIAQDDAYVSSNAADLTHPATDFLLVNNQGSIQDTYLRFETTTLNKQIKAEYLILHISDVSGDLELRIISTATGWSEETITWDNRPAHYGEITTFSISSGHDGKIKIPLPDPGDPEGAIVSFCLTLSSVGHFKIVSKENSAYSLSYAPSLAFVEQDYPIPGSDLSILILISTLISIIIVFKIHRKRVRGKNKRYNKKIAEP